MSVRVDERTDGKLKVNMKAQEMCVYTLRITSNKKVFVERYDGFTEKINQTAIDIHAKCWAANNIVVNSHEDYVNRRALQEEAAVLCNVLLSYIGIAKSLYHLETKRVKYWGGLLVGVRNLIRAWRDSDSNRYGKYK